jgi:hypothetical protein
MNRERLDQLIEIFSKGGNLAALDEADAKLIAMALRSIRAVADANANYGPFICGTIGVKDDMGLYDKFMICPQYGLSGFAVYKKDRDYSEPGY